VLKHFEKKGLVSKHPSDVDGRVTLISLTAKGKTTYDKLNEASNMQVELLISKLNKDDQQKLTTHMQAIMELLSLNDASG
jgi:DNA-binding MarR family transcriptional regulator